MAGSQQGVRRPLSRTAGSFESTPHVKHQAHDIKCGLPKVQLLREGKKKKRKRVLWQYGNEGNKEEKVSKRTWSFPAKQKRSHQLRGLSLPPP